MKEVALAKRVETWSLNSGTARVSVPLGELRAALDHIETLEARVATLSKALEPFGHEANWHERIHGKDADDGLEVITRLGKLRAAREASR